MPVRGLHFIQNIFYLTRCLTCHVEEMRPIYLSALIAKRRQLVQIVDMVKMLVLFAKVYFTCNLICNIFTLIIIDINVTDSHCTDYDVRLVDGASPNEGKVQMCINGVWGVVCLRYLYTHDVGVICHQLGFQREGLFLYTI